MSSSVARPGTVGDSGDAGSFCEAANVGDLGNVGAHDCSTTACTEDRFTLDCPAACCEPCRGGDVDECEPVQREPCCGPCGPIEVRIRSVVNYVRAGGARLTFEDRVRIETLYRQRLVIAGSTKRHRTTCSARLS